MAPPDLEEELDDLEDADLARPAELERAEEEPPDLTELEERAVDEDRLERGALMARDDEELEDLGAAYERPTDRLVRDGADKELRGAEEDDGRTTLGRGEEVDAEGAREDELTLDREDEGVREEIGRAAEAAGRDIDADER